MKNVQKNTATIDVVLPLGSPFFICAKLPTYEDARSDYVPFRHQGIASWNTVSVIFFLIDAHTF